MKVSYKWLKWYVPELPEEESLADVFNMHLCEVESVEKFEEDTIFDLAILPNRAHDLLGHRGVAKEISSQLGLEFKDPRKQYEEILSKREIKSTNLKINVEENCKRYCARIIRNVKVEDSPLWVQEHLRSIGERPVNNIVDATNLVMFDLGQPCHAFDLDKLSTEEIFIQNASEQEKVELLDRTEVILDKNMLTVRDKNQTLAIAGVKGTRNAQISADTKNILIEIANFDPVTVRKTARKLHLLTASAKRFENEISPEMVEMGNIELSALLAELFPDAEIQETIDVYPHKQEIKKINFSREQANKILGVEISADEIEKIFSNYNFSYQKNNNEYVLEVPPYRLDLEKEIDVIEEVGRIYGYEKILPKIPTIKKNEKNSKREKVFDKIKAVKIKLMNEGYREVMNQSFASKGDVEVLESAGNKNFLRNNLKEGIKNSITLNETNKAILGIDKIKIFEIGTVFEKGVENLNIAFGDKKNILEYPLEKFDIEKEFYLESMEFFREASKSFRIWSPYPAIIRDIALWVPSGTEAETIQENILRNSTFLLRPPELFDRFEKDNKISLAFRLVFQSYDRTLTDEEVNKIMQKVTQELENCGFTIR